MANRVKRQVTIDSFCLPREKLNATDTTKITLALTYMEKTHTLGGVFNGKRNGTDAAGTTAERREGT